MKFSHRLKAHPLRLLLYLEWILFLISIILHFRNKFFPSISIRSHPLFLEINPNSYPLSLIFIFAFILLGIWHPNQRNISKIIYISCNPATQARDIELLSERYKVTVVQPVDMFPHTAHVENIVVLENIR